MFFVFMCCRIHILIFQESEDWRNANSTEELWFIAAKQGRPGVLMKGIEGGLIDIVDLSGAAALHLCSLHGHIDCIRILLNAGAGLNSEGVSGIFEGK